MLKRTLVYAGLLPLLLSGCGGSGGSSSGGGSSPTAASLVKIDAMGDIPVIRGSKTRGTIYVHNYGSQAVTGISYSVGNPSLSSKVKGLLAKAGLKLSGIEDENGFILENPGRCSSIAAGSSCAITISTPNLSFGNQGNSLVIASYNNGVSQVNSQQVVNYSYTDPNQSGGVNFSGTLRVSGEHGSTQYVVGYLSGSGSASEIYNNVRLLSSNPSTRISGGFVDGQEVGANQVIAVEFAVAMQNGKENHVNVTPAWGSSQVASAKSLKAGANSGVPLSMTLLPQQDTVNYIFGNVPILTAPTSGAVAINVVNNGNATGQAITATASGNDASALSIDDSNCSSGLPANTSNSCQISFSVPGFNPGTTTVEYHSGGQVVGTQQIIWTNDKPFPAVSVAVSPVTSAGAPYEFDKRTDSGKITFTLRNVGKAPLTNASYPYTLTGPAVWSESSNSCSATLGVNATCEITGTLYGANDGTGIMYTFAKGNYESTAYSFVSFPLNYQVDSRPDLAITPAEVMNWTILANGQVSKSQVYTVQNIGNDDAAFTGLNLTAMTTVVKPRIVSQGAAGECSGSTTLPENGSCTVTVSYGPAESSITANESGTTRLNVSYQGGTPFIADTAVSESINYRLVGNDSYLVESITATGLTGEGTQASPYIGTPKINPMKITVTVTNPSMNYPMSGFNLNTNNLPYGVVVDPSSTCATGSETMSLESGASCTMVFAIDRELLKTSAQGGSIIYDFTSPLASWTTPLGFYSQSGEDLHLQYRQPTVTFSLTDNNGSFTTTTLEMLLTDGDTAETLPLPVTVSGVSDWLESEPINPSSNCSVDSSTYAVNCGLGGSAATVGGVTYVMPNYMQPGESANIPLIYTTSSYAYLNPTYDFIRYFIDSEWVTIGGSTVTSGTPWSIQVNNNIVYLGGNGVNPTTGMQAGGVWRYYGAAWGMVGNGYVPNSKLIMSIAVESNILYAGGNVLVPNTKAAVWQYVNNAWSMIGESIVSLTSNSINSIIVKNGVIYAGGANFSAGVYSGAVWKYADDAWSQLGGPIAAAHIINSITMDASGNIYAAGRLSPGGASGLAAVWEYDSENNNWVLLGGSGIAGTSTSNGATGVTVDNGVVLVSGLLTGGGNGAVWKYTDSAWSMVGESIPNSGTGGFGGATSVTVHNGVIYASGTSYASPFGGAVWKYTDGVWNLVDGTAIPASNSVTAFTFSNDILYATGQGGGGIKAWQYK